VLGRIGSGSTVAALPWAGVLVAATNGAVVWAIAGSVVTAAIMLWAFAPWIRGLQKLVPAFNHVQTVETAWSDGQALLMEHVTSDEQLKGWVQRLTEWENRVSAWITEKCHPSTPGGSSVRR
jgi:hypothetical protein